MAAVTAGIVGSVLVATTTPAYAAGPWFVSTTGNDANTCLSPASPCRNINGALAKPGFVPGDTINVAAGTYLSQRPSITKAVNIVGAGAATTIINASATQAAPASTVTVNIPNASPNKAVTISGVTITGGWAPSFGGGGIAHFSGNLTVTDSVVTGNTAGGVANTVGGGGIFALGQVFGTTTPLTLTRVTVSNNKTVLFGATAFPGGGIYTTGSTTITDSTITGNTATGATAAALGGGVYVNRLVASDNGVLTVGNTSITSNTSAFGGGVTVAPASTANVTGGSISSNTAISGGGLYVLGVGNLVPNVSGSASLAGTTVSLNTANGGAILNGGNGGGIFSSGTLNVSAGATLSGNRALATSTAGSAATGWGGAIYMGPVAAGDKPVATINDSTLSGGGQTANALVGGGIAQAGNVFNAANTTPAVLTASRDTFSGNVAAFGAGAYLGAVATVNESTITGNVANNSSGIGGGLYIAKVPAAGASPAVIVDSTDVTLNSAATGAGIGVNSSSTLTLRNGSSVDHNNAAVFGGGLFNAGATTVTDSHVDLNTSGFQGGGVWNGSSVVADLPSVSATNSTVDGNSAASAGGGVIVAARASLTTNGGSISSNLATAAGGVYVAELGTATLDLTTISDNTANGSSGGGLLNSGTTSISRSLIAGNEAIFSSGNTGLGGAIYSGSNAAGSNVKLTLDRDTITDNTARTASALVTLSTGGGGATNLTSIRNSTIHDNHTLVGFSAIAPFHPMTIVSTDITDNDSPAGGSGGLFPLGGPIGVAGSIIAGNSGGNCSSAVVDGGHNLTDPGDATCGFPPASRVDPELGPLANNGGPTPTQLPDSTSPAINAIPPSSATGLNDAVSGTPVVLCAPASTDQRGTARPQGPTCDIGAVEADLSAPTVSGPASPVFVTGAPASYGYTSTGVPAPDLSVTGTLPTGVTFVDNGDGTGTLAGTPAAGTGGEHPVTIVGSNGVAPDFGLPVTVIVHEPAGINGPASDTYVVGELGGPNTFTTTGHPTASLSTSSELPGGVTFTDNADGTATITGTPADGEGGVYPITIEATNGIGATATFLFTLTVNEAPTVDGPDTATYTVGEAGGPDVFTTSGFPTASLSTDSVLPDGVTLVDNGDGTAALSGTPADGEGGVYAIEVTASNGVGTNATTTITLTVNEAPEITGPDEVRFVIGAPDSVGYSTSSYPVAELSASGALPPGVTFVDNGNGTGTLAGTATTAGTYVITISASNDVDPDATLEVTITVVPPVEITTTTLPSGSVGVQYNAQVLASGGAAPYAFQLVGGSLPAGLTLHSDGTITGTPTGPTGTSTFTVEVTDALDPPQTATQELSITIDRGPTTLTVQPVVLSTTGGPIKVTVGRVSARLTGGTPAVGLGGELITFKAGATTVCTAVTASDGTATCTMSPVNTLLVILNLGVTASYAGSPLWQPASGSGGLL